MPGILFLYTEIKQIPLFFLLAIIICLYNPRGKWGKLFTRTKVNKLKNNKGKHERKNLIN